MRLWRICREAYAAETLVGRGGLVVSGRWHSKGRPIIYTATSLALAALETLVHADRSSLPDDLVQVEIDLDDAATIENVRAEELPPGWRAYPAPEVLRRTGDGWLQACTAIARRGPSAVIPSESNVLLNPGHGDAQRVRVVAVDPFVFDRRLVR